MNKFTLKMEDDYGRTIEHSFEEETLQEVLMHLDMFVRGCGYVINTYDQLDYVDYTTNPCDNQCVGCDCNN
jgi:hypothetical protein